MTSTKKELEKQFATLIEDASEEELRIMEHTFKGWIGKRHHQYNSYVESWLLASRRWKDDQTYEVVIPNHEGFQNALGITHGGVTVTLLDTTMGEMTNDVLPEGEASVTLEIKVNFVKAGKGKKLRCESTFISQNKKIKVTEAKVFDEEEELIAHATGTFYTIHFK